jgi:hypothetical protein
VTPERVYVIEINPFNIGAGAGLFSWRTGAQQYQKVVSNCETDRELFLNGPFEFRVLEKLTEDPLDFLPGYWKNFVSSKIKMEEEDEEEDNSSFWLALTAAVLMAAGAMYHKYYK